MTGRVGRNVPLFERDAELEILETALRAAPRGGRTIAVTGPPGSGKTALLRFATRQAEEAGMTVLSARGSELERGFAFSGMRQLFERPLGETGGTEEPSPRSEAMALGRAALGLDRGAPLAEPDALHSLWWVLVELAERAPVLLAIDDAQWLDLPTLRWIGYATHRLAEVPALAVLASREAPPPPPELRDLLARPETTHLSPAPLGEGALAALLSLRLGGGEPDPEFIAACLEVGAGNPFVASELSAALAAAGIAPTREEADRVGTLIPASISRWLLARLDRLGPDATRLARALAVAGDGSSLALLAAAAQLSPAAAEDAAAALAREELILDAAPARFAHDLVRGAVEAAIPAVERAAAHRRCAEALAAIDADPEAIAVHWEAAEPTADPRVVAGLREAAAAALGRGDPAAALRYLRRAEAEGIASDGLLRELGRAELFARDPGCAEHLAAALAAEDDPRRRAEIGLELADALMFSGRWAECLALNRDLRADLRPEDPLAFALDTFLPAVLLTDHAEDPESELARLRERALVPQPAAGPLCLQIACLLALRGEAADRVEEMVARGYADGRVFEVTRSDSAALVTAAMALIFVERHDTARTVVAGMLADARRHGLVLGHVAGATHRGLLALREGDLHGAEADLRDSFALAREHDISFTMPFIAAYLAEALLARGEAAEAAATLAAVPDPDPDALLPGYAAFYLARGTVRGAGGDREGAISDLRTAGAAQRAMHSVNPLACPWRSRLAIVLGGGEEAVALATAELELGEALGAPAAVGLAAHALALLDAPTRREERLRLAVDRLAESPYRLEEARVRIDLGSVLRRAEARTEAREQLLLGLDLADRAGAPLVAERARAEAVTAGARPRRDRVAGAGALTPAELRVARLAAEGMTNRQIAQSLFITLGTVKDHLGSAYRKLGIASRTEMAAALRAG